jgi:hypothetical protein
MSKEAACQQIKPYLNWRLLELDTSYDKILICTPLGAEDRHILILTGKAAQVWLLYYLAR